MKLNHQDMLLQAPQGHRKNRVVVRRLGDCFAALAMTALFVLANDGAFDGAVEADRNHLVQVVKPVSVNK